MSRKRLQADTLCTAHADSRALRRPRNDSSSRAAYAAISEFEILLLRLHNSHLLPDTKFSADSDGAVRLCRTLGGLQAQASNAAALSIWNRLENQPVISRSTILSWMSATPRAVGIVRCHGQRGTIHVYDTQTWPVVCAVVRERLLRQRRQGVGGADVLSAAHESLSKKLDDGCSVSADDLPDADFSMRYGAFMSVTLYGHGARVETSGRTVIAPRAVVAPDLPRWELPSEHEAVVHLARTYFSSFAPATEQDFRYYMGIRANVSVAAVSKLLDAGELLPVNNETSSQRSTAATTKNALLVSPDTMAQLETIRQKYPTVQALPPLLLGRFDVLLLGHQDKSWIIDKSEKHHVWSMNAEIRATVLVRGRVCATWTHELLQVNSRNELRVAVQLFKGVKLNSAEKKQLNNEARRLACCFFEAPSCKIDYVSH